MSPHHRQAFKGSVLLADEHSQVAPQPPSQKTSGRWRTQMGHPNQPLPAMTSQEPPLDRSWLQELVRQVSRGPSEYFECAYHTSSENRATPRGGWGGHGEVIFSSCLRLSRRRPGGSSSGVQTLQLAGEVRCLAWGDCLPASVQRLPETLTLGF